MLLLNWIESAMYGKQTDSFGRAANLKAGQMFLGKARTSTTSGQKHLVNLYNSEQFTT